MSTSYLHLLHLAQQVGSIAFLLSTFFGLIQFFLTLFGVRQIFGTYKYLMLTFTFLGVLLAALETVLRLNIHFYNSGLVYFTLSRPLDMSKEMMKILLPLYPGVYCTTISLLAVQFIYRYWALFSSRYLNLFRGSKSFIWIFYCLFFGGTWFIGGIYSLKMDPTSESYFKDEMLLRYNVTSNDIPMLAFIAFDPIDNSIRWRDVSYTVVITIGMGFQYGVMIYCGWNMYSKMEEKIENFSVTLKHHHRQLFKTLVLQITAPTIFLFSPLVIILYLPYFQFQLSIPAGAPICAFSFYPAMDSIIVLLVVTEYRVAVKRMWKGGFRKIFKSSIVKDRNLTMTTGMSVIRSTAG